MKLAAIAALTATLAACATPDPILDLLPLPPLAVAQALPPALPPLAALPPRDFSPYNPYATRIWSSPYGSGELRGWLTPLYGTTALFSADGDLLGYGD